MPDKDDFNMMLSLTANAVKARYHAREAFIHSYLLRRIAGDVALTPQHREKINEASAILGETCILLDTHHEEMREQLDLMLADLGLLPDNG